MTFIQPKKEKNTFMFVVTALFALLLGGAVCLIVLYNRVVNLTYGVSTMKGEVQRIETETSELKGKLFALLDGNNLMEIAHEEGFVEERKPQYLEAQKPWGFALGR